MPSSVTPRQLTRLSWPAKIPAMHKHHDKWACPDWAHSFTAFLWKKPQFNIRTQCTIATTLPVVWKSCHIHQDTASFHVALDKEHSFYGIKQSYILHQCDQLQFISVTFLYTIQTHTHSHSHSYILDHKKIASSCHSLCPFSMHVVTFTFHYQLIHLLTLRLLMSYIYGAPILDVSRSHTTTQHSR